MARQKDLYIQALRGLAISAVVLIHALPQSEYSLLVRPFLNWGVALFLFISGLLSPEPRFASGGGVVRNRLVKVLVPYVLWSIAYFLLLGNGDPLSLLKGLLTGGCAAQLYYLLVYAQLVVLTPWFYGMLRRHRVLMYSVTPTALFLREVLGVFGLSVPHLASLFPVWLVYYLMGLDWGRVRPVLKRLGAPGVASALAAVLVLQGLSGFLWFSYGSYDLATTQLKISSMLTALLAISLFMLAGNGVRGRLARCGVLTGLGDLSFGVYLCHIAVLVIARKIFMTFGLAGFGWCFAVWFITLFGSALLVWVCRRFLPKRLLAVIGFV